VRAAGDDRIQAEVAVRRRLGDTVPSQEQIGLLTRVAAKEGEHSQDASMV
jgi:hypothetical protein